MRETGINSTLKKPFSNLLSEIQVAVMPLEKLVICITFYYVLERPCFLTDLINGIAGVANQITLIIITNLDDSSLLEHLVGPLPENFTISYLHPSGIGHPFLLTWTHREILEEVANKRDGSYFLYCEDDILVTLENVLYWLESRDALNSCGFYPSFLRVEYDLRRGAWVSTDCPQGVSMKHQPILFLDNGDIYVNASNPYQGMYLLDPDLIQEMVSSPAMSPDFGFWNIREKAAQGLTFVNIPHGFHSRNLLRVEPIEMSIDRRSWLHHLSNNYALNDNTAFGSQPMDTFLKDIDHFRFLSLGS
ncbi:hypothetical protein [Synechococcus sp. CCY 9618]|uniref:hypothetical protein n=1 Tax=Synechococcus sp. CCY 9618 TaxID=2815602 RepID=UPI001C248593|nr:hypothetical protein [Synechococcus sp. CCY 9618]